MTAGNLASSHPACALYSDHHGWLVGWLRKKLGDATDAADLAHDTFLRILARPAFDLPLREPQRYLAAIANGLVIDHWRRKRIEQAYAEALARQPETWAPSAETRFIILETLCALDAMLDRLSAKVRQAFLLAQLDGLTYAEIGRRLGVSDRMVRKYMAQAMHACLMLDLQGGWAECLTTA